MADEVRPAAPRSWRETISPWSSSSSEHSISFFSANGSPIWTVGRCWSGASPSPRELRGGQHRRAADAVAAGGGAEQEHGCPAPRPRANQPLAPSQAERHRVDQAVLRVGLLEVELAADRRHADRVAVVGDARHRTVEQIARALARRIAEAQRVEHRDRARADREDVAQDAADAGGGALEGLDGAGVVVGLDLERAHEAAADIDGAGVLARPQHHVRALGGQRPQQPWSACRHSARSTAASTSPARPRWGGAGAPCFDAASGARSPERPSASASWRRVARGVRRGCAGDGYAGAGPGKQRRAQPLGRFLPAEAQRGE